MSKQYNLQIKLSAADWQKEEIRQLIEEKNYTALSDLLGELPASPAARALDQLPRLFGGADVFGQAATLSQSAAFQAALRELEQLYRQLIQADPAAEVLVDFGLVNQAEYYTGIVFRGYLPGIGQPVLSGGRYDRLLNDFGLQKPAIGFAIHLDAVAGYLQKTQPQQPLSPTALVYWPRELAARGFSFLQQLRSQGVRCENSLADSEEEAKIYARIQKIPKLYIVGEQMEEITIGEEPV